MNFLIDVSLFRRNRAFALLYVGQFVSFFGTMMTSVALPYQIYMRTHSTLMVGLLSLAQLFPILFTALIGGVFADRYHRRLLLLASESILMIGSLLLAYNAYLTTPSIAMIFIIAFLMSGFNGLHRPALSSLTQQIVAKTDFPAATALSTFQASVGMIAGPAVGGLLIANFGVVTTYLTDFSSFLISLLALSMIQNIPKPSAPNADDSTWQSLLAGFRYACSRQALLGTYFVDFIAMIFGMPTALFPALAQSFGGAKALGMLYAAPAVGGLLLSLFSGWTHRVRRHGAAIAWAAIGWGVAIIFFGLMKQLLLALFFLALAGAFDAISGVFRGMMWNETIPNTFRGRLAGIEMISYLSGPRMGDAEAGLVAAAFGVTTSIVSGGVLCVLGVAICCYCLPKFWWYDNQVDAN